MTEMNKQNLDHCYLNYHKDGLIDIFIGLGMIFAGILLRTELPWMGAILVPTFIPVWQKARQEYFRRRVTRIEVESQQPGRQKFLPWPLLLFGGLSIAGIGIFLLLALGADPIAILLKEYVLLIIGAVFAGGWIFASYSLRLKRFLFHGLLTIGAFTLAQIAWVPFWLAFSFLGAGIFLVGLIVLLRFLNESPLV